MHHSRCLLMNLSCLNMTFFVDIRYSPEQLFAVVAAVDLYEDFLPWCQRSEILRRNPDGSFDAELEIGFKFLVESYVSHVELEKPKYIKVRKFLSISDFVLGCFTAYFRNFSVAFLLCFGAYRIL